MKNKGRRAVKTDYRAEYKAPDRTKNRSDRYQPLFAELPYSNEMMVEFADSQGLTTIEEYNEEILDLKEELIKEFWRLVDTQLTNRQSEVIHLWAEGKTQTEIAKILNVNQSSITKSINGNCDYRNGKSDKKIYGGAKKKIQKLALKDEKIKAIFKRMADIIEERDSY